MFDGHKAIGLPARRSRGGRDATVFVAGRNRRARRRGAHHARSAGNGTRRRCHTVERQRQCGDSRVEPDRSFVGAQLRDGARSGVRRRQRHRRWLQAVPGQTSGEPVGLDRCRRRHRGVPRAPLGRPGKPDRRTCNARCAVHRRTCGRARRRREGRWHRSRRSSCSCHARSTYERRPQSDHAVPVRLRHHARRVAGDPAADDSRPHSRGSAT